MEVFIGLIPLIAVSIIAYFWDRRKNWWYLYKCPDCHKVIMFSRSREELGVHECECGWRDYIQFSFIEKYHKKYIYSDKEELGE